MQYRLLGSTGIDISVVGFGAGPVSTLMVGEEFAIGVLAGGALAGNEPSPHTLKTPFFPIDLYERDRQRAAALCARLGTNQSIAREAIQFAISHPLIHSALIGLAATAEIDEAVTALSSF